MMVYRHARVLYLEGYCGIRKSRARDAPAIAPPAALAARWR